MKAANYSGKSSHTGSAKHFVIGHHQQLWSASKINNEGVLTPSGNIFNSVLIPKNLYVHGSIINTSDIYLKDNITDIDINDSNNLLNLIPRTYTLKSDSKKEQHFGFIAQEVEEVLPQLVHLKPDKQYPNIKAVNYLECIPLLVHQIQHMSKEIAALKENAVLKNK